MAMVDRIREADRHGSLSIDRGYSTQEDGLASAEVSVHAKLYFYGKKAVCTCLLFLCTVGSASQ
jgi:hypothetical protein